MEIQDIKNIQLDLQFRGYNMRQVDGVLENVTKLVSELTEKASVLKRKNMDLNQQINALESEKITAYNEYLEYAKIISEQKISEAEQKSAALIRSAECKARTITGDADRAVAEAQNKLDKIERDARERIESSRIEIIQIMNFTEQAKKQIDNAFNHMGDKSSACLALIENAAHVHTAQNSRVELSSFDESIS